MATIRDIVVDSPHPAAIARFWASVLDGYQVAPYDEAELARLRAGGIYDIEDDPSVLVEPAPGVSGPAAGGAPVRFFFQLVPEPKVAKNRVHLDITASDSAAELARLIELGARIVAEHPSWTTLADPDGNEFCLVRS
jgi:hypothetical protein